jgi:hypothetical protein
MRSYILLYSSEVDNCTLILGNNRGQAGLSADENASYA